MRYILVLGNGLRLSQHPYRVLALACRDALALQAHIGQPVMVQEEA
jgi:hypothetical protein